MTFRVASSTLCIGTLAIAPQKHCVTHTHTRSQPNGMSARAIKEDERLHEKFAPTFRHWNEWVYQWENTKRVKTVVVANFRIVNIVHKIINIENKCQMTRFLEYWILLSYLYDRGEMKTIYTHTISSLSLAFSAFRLEWDMKHKQHNDSESISLYEKSFPYAFMDSATIACYGCQVTLAENWTAKQSSCADCNFQMKTEKRNKQIRTKNIHIPTGPTPHWTKLMLILYLITVWECVYDIRAKFCLLCCCVLFFIYGEKKVAIKHHRCQFNYVFFI